MVSTNIMLAPWSLGYLFIVVSALLIDINGWSHAVIILQSDKLDGGPRDFLFEKVVDGA